MTRGWKIASIIGGIIAALALIGGAFAAGNWYARTQSARAPQSSLPWGWQNGHPGWGNPWMRGWKNHPGWRGRGEAPMPYQAPRALVTPTPLTAQEAKQAVESYLQTLGLSGLEVSRVLVFDRRAYAVVQETQSGMGAFEVFVHPVTRVVSVEKGTGMVWNQKYGVLAMYGRKGLNRWGTPSIPEVSAEMSVSEDQAKEAAQKFLDGYLPGATVSRVTRFYGYYAVEYAKDGKTAGVLHVNGNTAQVAPLLRFTFSQLVEEWQK
jgi:hypothetical protein